MTSVFVVDDPLLLANGIFLSCVIDENTCHLVIFYILWIFKRLLVRVSESESPYRLLNFVRCPQWFPLAPFLSGLFTRSFSDSYSPR